MGSLAGLTFALTALVVLATLALQIHVSAAYEGGHFQTVSGRVFNLFCYFTIWANCLVGATCLVLAVRPQASSTAFRVFRLAAIVAIALTFIVYHVALAHLHELEGRAATADLLLHTIVPIMAVAGWLLFGPRGLTSAPVAWWTTAVPIIWLVFTMLRGPVVDYYPYPFLHVRDLGYARVLVNVVVIAVIFLGLAGGAHVVDRWLDVRFRRPGRAPVRGV